MKHIVWRYYPNHWRRFCNRWWYHWVRFDLLWYDIRDAWQRVFRGWGDGDIYDLMTYHAGVTIGLLEHFRAHHMGYTGDSPEAYNAQLDLAIDGWKAKWDYLNDIGWDSNVQTHEEWSKPLLERWEKGNAAFLEVYDSLWV